MTDTAGGDLLATILAATRRIVEIREERESLAHVAKRAEAHIKPSGALRTAIHQTNRINVIAECKRRSPSRGVLRAAYDPPAIAAGYVRAGAVAISVLTEPTFFDGSLEHLKDVKQAVGVPILRKDFVISDYQLFEAAAAGADAVLLIVAALQAADLKALLERAAALGLDALVEVHDQEELAQCLDLGAQIVGVNNRNLRTLEVDVRTSYALIERIPKDVVAVSESGLKTAADLWRLRAAGYRAFLIGEQFMTAADPEIALRELLRSGPATKEGHEAKGSGGLPGDAIRCS